MTDRRNCIVTVKMDWKDFELAVQALTREIRIKHWKIKNIYGVPRGGLVIAVRLSHLLGKPLITKWEDRVPETLVVDDCVDSGKTLASLACARVWKIVALFYNPSASFKPHLFVLVKNDDQWIEFPWESN